MSIMSEELTNEQQWWAFAHEVATKLGFNEKTTPEKITFFEIYEISDPKTKIASFTREKFINILKDLVAKAPTQ